MKSKSYVLVMTVFMAVESLNTVRGQEFEGNSILNSLQSITESTVPSNGDGNPYGVAFVPPGFPGGGSIAPGDLLVSNFNNKMSQQGTGTTIVSFSPTGQQSVFATSTAIGLDTALGVLSRGFVLVGNLPVTYPGAMPHPGSLQILNKNGGVVATLKDATLDSPWDLTINDQGSKASVFVSNVLSGTVTRVDLTVTTTSVTVTKLTKIADGYTTAPNDAAVVVGPTGLAYDAYRDILYVASTDDDAIYAVENAAGRTGSNGKGSVVFADQKVLHGPLGLVLAPNGHLITANGDAVFAGGTPNELVEFSPQGFLVAQYQIDAGNAGAAFGLAITSAQGVRFAAVDDNLNTVTIWNLRGSSQGDQ